MLQYSTLYQSNSVWRKVLFCFLMTMSDNALLLKKQTRVLQFVANFSNNSSSFFGIDILCLLLVRFSSGRTNRTSCKSFIWLSQQLRISHCYLWPPVYSATLLAHKLTRLKHGPFRSPADTYYASLRPNVLIIR